MLVPCPAADVPNAELLRDVEPPSRTMREPQLPLAREHLARQIGRPPLRKASEDVGWSDNDEFESATSDDEPTTPRSTPIPDEPALAATAAEPEVQAAAAAEPDKATAPASLPAPTSPGVCPALACSCAAAAAVVGRPPV